MEDDSLKEYSNLFSKMHLRGDALHNREGLIYILSQWPLYVAMISTTKLYRSIKNFKR